MAEAQEENADDAKEFGGIRRTRAPSKKKFDEEIEALCNSIRKTEEQLEAIKNSGTISFADAQKTLRAEKNASIERRKKIDVDLQKLNKDITEMMNNIGRLESTLHYRSEDKIDEAIRRLEWSLKVQNFKLSQEKKIVAEIDSLRRSKKTLMQYLSMKKDKDAMRDRQRRMREERDYYFHKVTELKQREEKMRAEYSIQRNKSEQLKKELDRLYETKRQMVSSYKKQREDFYDDREKRRHESFKKRMEEKQALQTALRKEREEYEAQKMPYEDDICLCSTLINYLHRFISNTDVESVQSAITHTLASLPSPTEEQALPAATGPAEELEDGQLVLLRRSDSDNYVSCSAKHSTRKQRRSRKQSMVKKITHTPEVLAQFLRLNLNAPTTVAEILASVEQLKARKLYYEREAEVKSEAELSVTESAQCEVSRQASHTESNDGLGESHSNHQVVEQLLQLSTTDQFGHHGDDFESLNVPWDGQGHKEIGENDNEVFRMNTGDREEPLGFSHCSDSAHVESTHGRSTSEGSDSTPRSSSTVDGACGEYGEACGHSLKDDLEPVLRHGYSPAGSKPAVAKSDTSCDTCSTVGGSYAKKAGCDVNTVTPETCSDLAPKTTTVTSAWKGTRRKVNHIRRGTTGSQLHAVSPSSRPQSCDSDLDITDMSSLQDFPALVRDRSQSLGVSDRGARSGREAHFRLGKTMSVTDSTRL